MLSTLRIHGVVSIGAAFDFANNSVNLFLYLFIINSFSRCAAIVSKSKLLFEWQRYNTSSYSNFQGYTFHSYHTFEVRAA